MDFHAEQVYIFFTYNTIPPLFYWFCCFWTIVQTYIPPSPALGQFGPIWPHAWGSPRFGWQAELCHQKVLPSTASNWPKMLSPEAFGNITTTSWPPISTCCASQQATSEPDLPLILVRRQTVEGEVMKGGLPSPQSPAKMGYPGCLPVSGF